MVGAIPSFGRIFSVIPSKLQGPYMDVFEILDQVAEHANGRKKDVALAAGFHEEEIDDYLTNPEVRKYRTDISALQLKWYRRSKNQTVKNFLTLEGIKRGYSVRAEKTMGALPEYQKMSDQTSYNRFDLSWESKRNSRDFVLAVEIEMTMDVAEVIRDFKKLLLCKKVETRLLVCQAKTDRDEAKFITALSAELSAYPNLPGQTLVSIWSWSKGQFSHQRLSSV